MQKVNLRNLIHTGETLLSELDKSSEEKKRLGRGKALMQAAAAAAKWRPAQLLRRKDQSYL